MRSVPDIVIETTSVVGASAKDELDSLLTAHLDRFSDEEGSSASIRSTSQGSAVTASILPLDTGHLGKRPTSSGMATASTQGLEGILCLPYPARSGAGMAQFLEEGGCRNMEADALFFHQSLPETEAVSGLADVPHTLETPVPGTVRSAALRFHHLRDLLRGTTRLGEGEGGQQPSSSADWGRIFLPESVKVIPGNLMTPRRGRLTLAQSIAWLGMQAGFESVQRSALDCLTDILSHYLGAICTALKLYIEDLSTPTTTDVPAASKSLLNANYLVQEYEPRGARALLRLVRDAPEQLERRLEKAIWVVRERLQALATLGTEEYRGAGGVAGEGLGDEERNAAGFGEDATAATDIDLDLLGGGDDSASGGQTSFSGAGGTDQGWPLTRGNGLARGDEDPTAGKPHIVGGDHEKGILDNGEEEGEDDDEDDDGEDPSGGENDQSTLQELLDEPLDFATPLHNDDPRHYHHHR